MNSETMDRFKALFEEQRDSLVHSLGEITEYLEIGKDDLLDEVDLTSTEMERTMRVRLRNREALFLRKVNEALRRIEEGNFGECESCGEDIDVRRLEARPTATLCVSCKEAEERKEQIHIDGHKPKSLGASLRLA